MAKTMQRTLKGFRDFLPADKAVRDGIELKIVEVFRRFGFQPVETPTLEYAELILGKYGEEADRLVYTFEDRGGRRVALPYDQTVPTARVLSQYQRELPRYFRRYAIGNVFRAENPQKGRYREFRQCDIDIFGSTDPLADAEIIACTYFAFHNVGYPQVRIRINDRRSLVSALEPFATEQADVFSIIRTLDKLDKLRREAVVAELVTKGLPEPSALDALGAVEQSTPSPELDAVLRAVRGLGVPEEALEFSPMLARGLDYYTGAIFEVYVPGFSSGSLAGGGRYDELIEQLGGPKMPAVGIAFGFDRMVEAALHFDITLVESSVADVLVTIFDETTSAAALSAAAMVRAAGISCEVYPSHDKLGKQFKLAGQKQIPVVLIIGPDEAAGGSVTVRDMQTSDQQSVPVADLVERVQALLASSGT